MVKDIDEYMKGGMSLLRKISQKKDLERDMWQTLNWIDTYI